MTENGWDTLLVSATQKNIGKIRMIYSSYSRLARLFAKAEGAAIGGSYEMRPHHHIPAQRTGSDGLSRL